MEDINALKEEIVRLVQAIENDEWSTAEILIQFPPAVNKSYKTLPSFLGEGNNKLRLTPSYDESFDAVLFNLILESNKKGKYNEIRFQTTRNQYENAQIELRYNQEVVDKFEALLPKSKKGKIKAWYAPTNS